MHAYSNTDIPCPSCKAPAGTHCNQAVTCNGRQRLVHILNTGHALVTGVANKRAHPDKRCGLCGNTLRSLVRYQWHMTNGQFFVCFDCTNAASKQRRKRVKS